MKISDPLGKVYTHTMFKKRSSYDMKEQRDRSSKAHLARSASEEEDLEDVDEDHSEMEDDEEHSLEEDASEQSDDSLSTKSSRVNHHQQQQQQHERGASRSRSRPHSQSRRDGRMIPVSKWM